MMIRGQHYSAEVRGYMAVYYPYSRKQKWFQRFIDWLGRHRKQEVSSDGEDTGIHGAS